MSIAKFNPFKTNGFDLEGMMFSRRSLGMLLIPLVIEQILSATVGLVDMLMVSSVGEAAVSGVSVVDTINILIIQIMYALSTGGAVIVAQYIGRQDKDSADKTSKQIMHSMVIIGVVFAVVSSVFNKQLLLAIFGSVEKDVMSHSADYFRYSALSYPFSAIFTCGCALLRARGNSKISMFASFVLNIVHVIGNAILIYALNMGAAGAAISTLVARIFGAAVIIFMFIHPRSDYYIESFFKPKFNWKTIKRVYTIAIPNGIDTAMFDGGKLIIVSLVATLGTASIAANQIANKISALQNIPVIAISLAMTTIVGQCIGARKPDEAVKYAKILLSISYLTLFVMDLIAFIFAPQLVSIFNLSDEAVSICVTLTRINCVATSLLWPPAFNIPNAMRATGDYKFTMSVSILSMWICRIGFSYILVSGFNLGVQGVWYAMYIDWFVRALFFMTRFFRQKWRGKFNLI